MMDNNISNPISLQPVDDFRPARDWGSVLFRWLVTGTVAIGVVTLGGLLAEVVLRAIGRGPLADRLLLPMAWLLAGIAASVLACGVILLVRMQRNLIEYTQSLDQRLTALAEHAMAQSAHPGKPEPSAELLDVRRLLAEIREIMLLPEAQRLARFQTMMQNELRRRLTLTGQLIENREFHQAREELASLADRFGRSEVLAQMQERLTAAMQSALQEDIESATRKVADLMTMARWTQAEQYARELIQKYPEAGEPRRLLTRVQEERVVFDRRHRQRMHDEIQQFVTQRRWREAANAAEMFVQTFPAGPDVDALRQEMETLKANAEIEIRQQLERHIKEHISRKDYWAALELGRRIIAEYPFSPQASVLRIQLPRLEVLARQQGPRG